MYVKPRIVVVVEGGNVVSVHCSDIDAKYLVVDKDNIQRGDSFPNIKNEKEYTSVESLNGVIHG